MDIFKTKSFMRFAKRERIGDARLVEAIERAERGVIDADLGGGIIKQRVQRQGEGRRGGYRTLIVYRSRDFSVFVFGFAKSERDNITDRNLRDLQTIAAQWLGDRSKLEKDRQAGVLIEVKNENGA